MLYQYPRTIFGNASGTWHMVTREVLVSVTLVQCNLRNGLLVPANHRVCTHSANHRNRSISSIVVHIPSSYVPTMYTTFDRHSVHYNLSLADIQCLIHHSLQETGYIINILDKRVPTIVSEDAIWIWTCWSCTIVL